MRISVLRLGHRPERDKRITTHVALVARAFGAQSIHISERDPNLVETIDEMVERFGGDFTIQSGVSWKELIRSWNGPVVHLTMYGQPLEGALANLNEDDVLVIVGAEKVPPEVYNLADFNVAVTNQPHSEVASLAIFLDRLTQAVWTTSEFEGRMTIVPSKKGKIVIDKENGYLSDNDCKTVLKEAGCDEDIISHATIVANIAAKMAEKCETDVDLVRTAALLHDMGRTKTHGPRHGFEGAEILRGFGFPENIVLIVERHVGGGLDSEDAAALGLPERDMIPVTLEEKIVCIADKLVEDDKKVSIENEIQKLQEKGLDKTAKKVKALYDEIEGICSIGLDEIEI
jgi:tRNA (cytidine56-2'-O)-methyltransferase